MRADARHCAGIVRQHARTFALASHFLPPEKRRAAFDEGAKAAGLEHCPDALIRRRSTGNQDGKTRVEGVTPVPAGK